MNSYDIESRMRQLVFQKTREHLANRGRLSAIATQAGLTTKTVSKPRFHTVIAVCDAFGIRLVIEDTASVAVVPTVGKSRG